MADIYSFMQGFGEGQDRISRLKSEATDRAARAAETATNLFRLDQEQRLAPYKLRGDIAASLDNERLFRTNLQTDPYRVKDFIAKAEDSIANFKSNAELRPQMKELARTKIKSELLNLGAGYQETERSMANTTEERNAVLQNQGKNWRVVDEGNGTFAVHSADGKPIYTGLSEAELTVWYNNAAKYGAAQYQIEATDYLDANAAARGVKPQQGTMIAPATGFEAAQAAANPAQPQRQVIIPPELARAGTVGAAKDAEKANAEGIARAQALARAGVGQVAAVPTGMNTATPVMPGLLPSIAQTYLPNWMRWQ